MASILDQVWVLLREAKALPDDDTPRLVLADWLQDQGDPRGELIALQMQRHRLPRDDARLDELERRLRQLLSRHIFSWLGPLIDLASSWSFERGLLHVTFRAERLLGEDRVDLAHGPHFAWVETLHLTEVNRVHLRRLARSPLLDQLSHLDLSDNALMPTGLIPLLASPRLNGLRRLTLRRNRLGVAGTRSVLTGCRHFHERCVLDLGGNALDAACVLALRERFGDRVQLG